ncbi:bifunctional lysylphosphatidylglycerol flippase/synthetase MprF [Marinobacter subterrani]|uniref:bifunctional lysylphosphatidylglycerol flippase/synthetase MprF n=1 Tax=Marinobacter subterrani TaxID=1658765 RepID=UPI002353F725|nr:bifunctional lysylphosphatidylglycerol flippase/synthetase MprF [Marinobacter subterrani]
MVRIAPTSHRLIRMQIWLPSLVALLLLLAALWFLHRELQSIHYRDVRAALSALPLSHLLWALLFCAANYLVLSTYDQLAFWYIRKRLSRWRIALIASLSYAVSNNVGFALLSGTAVRHRFYSRWGVTPADLSRVVAFNATTYWLGLLALAGWSLTFHPHAFLQGVLAQGSAQWLGILGMATAVCYGGLTLLRKAPLRVRGFEMPIPSLVLAFGQLLVSMADWALAAAVLYALLPEGGPSYGVLLGTFLAAQLLGLISHVPGGLGVFEGVMALLLGPYIAAERIIAALLLYRIIYYIMPLTLALLVLLGDELRNRRAGIIRFGQSLGGYSIQLAPKILAVFTFMAGILLLFSGATPAVPARLLWLSHILPTAMFEASHLLGSLIGVALLLLAQALSRRIHLAYFLVLLALVAGILASLLKAADWEESLLLAFLIIMLIPSRRFFDRRAALFDTRFSTGWIIATAAALGASVWLGVFVYRHVEYSNALWWQVALQQDAPRFLRASLGAAVTLLGFGIWRLLRPLPHIAEPPLDDDLADAERIIHEQSETLPFLVWLRDKALLFNNERTAFIMYGTRGRTWVALGEPVGPSAAAPGLIREFVDRADDYGGVPVFYQVHPERLHYYADLGMAFAKLGESARAQLEGFSLEGSRHKDLRTAMNRLLREGVGFRVIEAGAVETILPQLKSVSDDWLASKSASEKGFSLGFFDSAYLSRQPVAVLEREGRIVAFANLLCGPTGEELSIDLMRFASDAPHGAMDGLFTHLLLWGQGKGYRWFDLGMAPLSGLSHSPISPLWNRLGGLLYSHGEAFYNFEGLRAYKEKFHPDWQPRYLAYPGGLALPMVLADIAALSAGGYLRIFR